MSHGRPRQDTTNSSVLLDIVEEMKHKRMRRARSAVDMQQDDQLKSSKVCIHEIEVLTVHGSISGFLSAIQ